MRALLRIFMCLWLSLAASGVAMAVQPDEMLPDVKLEARARELSRELRCLVCQNQSIDDSDASLARDLRLLLRERLKAGDTDQQVLDYLVSRYGVFVLLKPPFNAETVFLWLAPISVLIIAGAALLLIGWRRRGRALTGEAAAPLTSAEKDRLAGLMEPPREESTHSQ